MLQGIKQSWRDTKKGMDNVVDFTFFLIIVGFAIADFFVSIPFTGAIALLAVYVFSLITRIGKLLNQKCEINGTISRKDDDSK